MPHVMNRQRVAIAGTIANAATEEGLPQVRVRITQAPQAFSVMMMMTLKASIGDRAEFLDRYSHLFDEANPRSITADSLKTAQVVLDALENHHGLHGPRPDQTRTGGDGHYCFFDLPSGSYGVTATLLLPNQCHGSAQGYVQVPHSAQRFAFGELDLAMTVRPSSLSIQPRRDVEDLMLWPSAESQAHAALALGAR